MAATQSQQMSRQEEVLQYQIVDEFDELLEVAEFEESVFSDPSSRAKWLAGHRID